MTELLRELEAVVGLAEKASNDERWQVDQEGDVVCNGEDVAWAITNKLDAPYIAALNNLFRTHHAEIAESLADAAKWKKVEAVVAMVEDESDGQINTACGLLLIDRAASMKAGKLELKFSGVTVENDAELGDWIVTVKKSIDAHNSAREVGE